ncbi:hypothetical protein RHGRI_033355 [Rhododendron griersonianum]|uniref:RRM domain-containing protein n=1 Tax=Rhododendron griersonianum TaxID=479676 RepID=A0AAV6HWV8_9ERIC|nr:hypothetical protein RHGRI_033355 [Rhododendron griersonianum]
MMESNHSRQNPPATIAAAAAVQPLLNSTVKNLNPHFPPFQTAMGDAGFTRFPTCLDPRAEEYRPFNQVTLFQPQPHQIYYPYPQQPIADLHLTPFSDFTNTTNVAPFYAPQAHVSLPPLPPPLPPPSPAPTRTLLLSSVPTDVSESDVRRDLEIFGDVRAVQMERVRDGIVTVHFYDVRSSQRAAAEIRGQHMRQQGRLRVYYDAVLARNSSGEFGGGGEVWGPVPVAAPVGPGVVGGHAVWAQFKVPVGVGGVPDGVNQGTIVVFNLDEGVNTARLKEIFEAFGNYLINLFAVFPLHLHAFRYYQKVHEYLFYFRTQGTVVSEIAILGIVVSENVFYSRGS